MKLKDKVVFFSGGLGSFASAHRIFEESNTHLVFTDTLIECQSLYKFLLQSVEYFYKVNVRDLLAKVDVLPKVSEDMEKRKDVLKEIQLEVNLRCPKFHWLRYEVDGKGISVWDIFNNEGYLGNSRIARCSTILKQRMSKEYISKHFKDKTYDVVLGIDWTESHRTKTPSREWGKIADKVLFPLCEEPFIQKGDSKELVESLGIDTPLAYTLGFAHNNCGMFCVRAGQGHFKDFLEHNPEDFNYHALQEEALVSRIGKDVSILRKQVAGEKITFPLSQLRKDVLEDKGVDKFDIGGCGCFVTEDVEEDFDNPDAKWGLRDLVLVY